MLAFGRRQSLQPKLVDLNVLVDGMTEMLQRTLGGTVEIETRPARGLHSTLVDAAQVENAILNLAINARDAMPEGGILTIETARVILDKVFCETHLGARPGRYIHLRVGDSGIGMDDEVKTHIFDSAQPMNSCRCSERFL